MNDDEIKVKRIIIPHICGIFYDYDGCIEIIFKHDRFRLLLFWPPGFSFFTSNYLITWNVDKKLWFSTWKHDFGKRRKRRESK